MRDLLFRTAGLAGLVLVVACNPTAEAGPEGTPSAARAEAANTGSEAFVREAGLDYFGYYMADESRVFNGGWRLHHIFIGDRMMFDAFEAAGEPAEEAPVWLEFWPVGGETAFNELGQEYAVDSRRVRADSFIIESGRFELRAEDEAIGPVLVSGAIHPAAIDDPSSGPGFTGGIEVNGDLHRNVSLHYYMGD